ncbi:MAG: aminotransferase class IV [Phycisphaeraceae bacterium]
MDIYFNGRMVPPAEAKIPVDDAGFQHAVGLFETMAAVHGRVFRMPQHLARLAQSARELGLAKEIDTQALAAAVQQTIDHNHIDRARIRLTLTAGSMSLLRSGGESQNPAAPLPTLVITPTEPTQYDPAYFERGIMVLIAPAGANPFDALAGHKTLSYWGRLRTLRQAAALGAGEAIWLNVTNHLASGAVSNLFIVKDGELFTPIARGEEPDGGLPAPVLPGVTRATVLELAHRSGIKCHKQMLTVDDLLGADEVFLTNSSWQVLPVSKVERQAIGEGSVGEVTTALREGVLELIEKECPGSV